MSYPWMFGLGCCCSGATCCTDLNQYLNGDLHSNNYAKLSAVPGNSLVQNLTVSIPSVTTGSGGVSVACVPGTQVKTSLTVNLTGIALCSITPTMSITINWDSTNNWWIGSSNMYPMQTNGSGYYVWCKLVCCTTPTNHFTLQMWLADSFGTVLSVSKPTTESYTGFSLAGQDYTCAGLVYSSPDITGNIQPFTEWWGGGLDVAPRFWRPVNSYLLTVSGVSDDLCTSCNTLNGNFVLPFDMCAITVGGLPETLGYGYCLNSTICPVASDGHPGCPTFSMAGWNLTCDTHSNIVVQYLNDLSGAPVFFNFAIPISSFNPYDTNTLSNNGVQGVGGACSTHYPDLPNQCTWPASATVAWAS